MEILEANRFVDELNIYAGFDLAAEIEQFPQIRTTSVAFVNRAESLIEEAIKSRAARYNKDNRSAAQKAAVKTAIFEQIIYMIAGGDFSLLTGYDDTNNSLADIRELRKRAFSPLAIKILENAGLLHNGMRGRFPFGSGKDPQNFDLSLPSDYDNV
jgi:hypothetical protein